MLRLERVPLRVRVAAAFVATTALVLLGTGAYLYAAVDESLQAQASAGVEGQALALAQVPPRARADTLRRLPPGVFGQVLSRDGDVLAVSPELRSVPLVAVADLPSGTAATAMQGRAALVDDPELESSLLAAVRSGDQVMVIGTSSEDVADAVQEVAVRLLAVILVGLAVAAGAAYVVAGRALRPVERMRRGAEAISATTTGARLPLPAAQDEVRRLGETLNAMLERRDEGLRRERRFVAEAGHELRTPLALLRMELDLALARPRGDEELRTAIRSAGEEVDRLTRLSEDLLELAREPRASQLVDVDLAALLREVAARFSPAAAAAGRTLHVAAPPEVSVPADRHRLDRALSNLVDNALRHGAGDVLLCAEVHGDQVTVDVRDHGAGMRDRRPTEHAAAFASAGPQAGAGLGLSITAAVAEEHHGVLSVGPAADGPGTLARVTLPRG